MEDIKNIINEEIIDEPMLEDIMDMIPEDMEIIEDEDTEKKKHVKIENNMIVGFYDSSINKIEEDMQEITQEEYQELLEKQSNGYTLTVKKDGTIFPTQKPVYAETWDGSVWTSDKDKAVEGRISELSKYKNEVRNNTLIEFQGHKQKIRQNDTFDLNNILSNAQLEGKPQVWFFSDGTMATLSVDDIQALGNIMKDEIINILTIEGELKEKIEKSSIEELENFDIKAQWKELS